MIVNELKDFRRKLIKYINYRRGQIERSEHFKGKEARDFASTYDEISISSGKYAPLIKEYTGLESIHTNAGLQDVWTWAFSYSSNSLVINALDNCLQATNRTIGKLIDDINKGVRDEQGNRIEKPPTDIAESPLSLFDKMQFHPRVIQVSESLFKTGNYASAILEAFKAVDNYVKERTALSLNGQALMSKAFDENAPIIKLNDLLTQSDRDEQEGFKFLFKGATIGIRNPKAHDNVIQTDPYRTLEYLGLASLLMRRIEEGKLVRLSK